MFRFNGFTITILPNKVIATQAGVQIVFKTVEQAIEALAQ
jgi:hypothetical protein